MADPSIPPDFIWGTAASSTQAEGAAPASDWARWEQLGRAPRSKDGNGFGNRYAEDFDLLASFGLTHHRLSLEWARIEPVEGRRDPAEVERYRGMLSAAREAGVSIWVCLHHFTLPGWFSDDLGGFADDRARSYHWPRHVDYVAETFGDLVEGWMPVNEPVAYAYGAFLNGTMPPGQRTIESFGSGLRGALLADLAAWGLLRGGDQPVATIRDLSPLTSTLSDAASATTGKERAGAEAAARRWRSLLDEVIWGSWIGLLRDGVLRIPFRADEEVPAGVDAFDLVGFSYYSAASVDELGRMGPYPPGEHVGPLGHVAWSGGMPVVLERLAEELPGRPLLVAEHGVGTRREADDDGLRSAVVDESIRHVADAVAGGIDVRGFFHWTGVDNYEWNEGFDVAFGLFDRDRNPKGSASMARRWATGGVTP